MCSCKISKSGRGFNDITGSDLYGLHIWSHGTVTISKNTFLNNVDNGIEFVSVGSHNIIELAPSIYGNSSTLIFGNDVDNNGDADFNDH